MPLKSADIKKFAAELVEYAGILETKQVLTMEVAHLESRHRELQADVVAAEAAVDRHSRTVTTATARAEDEQRKARGLHERRIADLAAQEGPLRARLEQLRTEIAAAVNEAASQQQRLQATHESEVARLTQEKTTLEREIAGLRSGLKAIHEATAKHVGV